MKLDFNLNQLFFIALLLFITPETPAASPHSTQTAPTARPGNTPNTPQEKIGTCVMLRRDDRFHVNTDGTDARGSRTWQKNLFFSDQIGVPDFDHNGKRNKLAEWGGKPKFIGPDQHHVLCATTMDRDLEEKGLGAGDMICYRLRGERVCGLICDAGYFGKSYKPDSAPLLKINHGQLSGQYKPPEASTAVHIAFQSPEERRKHKITGAGSHLSGYEIFEENIVLPEQYQRELKNLSLAHSKHREDYTTQLDHALELEDHASQLKKEGQTAKAKELQKKATDIREDPKTLAAHQKMIEAAHKLNERLNYIGSKTQCDPSTTPFRDTSQSLFTAESKDYGKIKMPKQESLKMFLAKYQEKGLEGVRKLNLSESEAMLKNAVYSFGEYGSKSSDLLFSHFDSTLKGQKIELPQEFYSIKDAQGRNLLERVVNQRCRGLEYCIETMTPLIENYVSALLERDLSKVHSSILALQEIGQEKGYSPRLKDMKNAPSLLIAPELAPDAYQEKDERNPLPSWMGE